mmetsp:Transcript_56682/g.132463  ORF Transcript_56682/g.132463 Transcript_56682/m.132463 type:complete len:997 (+) Transcript_56682:111-3101(+)
MKGANSVHPTPSRFTGNGRPPGTPKKLKPVSQPPQKPTAYSQLQKLFRRLRKIKIRDPERMVWIRQKSRRLCTSWRFTVLTTALTIYALFGDDFRLCVTHKQTDELFNVLTVIACLVFGVEIFAQSLGQEEYFLGFFFFLDFGSTVTLILDLTWVSRELFCAGGEGEEALRTSRAGRAGARASRTVRIIRLMRLVKLYKAYWVAMEKKKEEEARKQKLLELKPGEVIKEPTETKSEFQVRQEGEDSDDFEGEETQREEDEPKQETRVGKKLSDMTTRRVIVLVLVMLVVLPQFEPSGNMFISTSDFQESAKYAADLIYSRWRSWCGTENTTERPWCLEALETPVENQQQHYRNRYEMEAAMLNFLHTHISGSFFYQLYWIGASSRRWADAAYLGEFSPLNQVRWLGQDLAVDEASLSAVWDTIYARSDFFQGNAIASLPSETKTRLVNVWQEQCRNAVGIVVQRETRAMSPTGCSVEVELRCSEVQYVFPLSFTTEESETFSFMFAFDQRGFTQLEAGLSILQTLFICFAVGVGAMTFSKDANELLLNPIERMIEKMETIKDNPLEAMRLGDLEFRREEVDEARFREKLEKMSRPWQILYKYRHAKKHKEPMETVMLEKTIIKLGGLLALGFGEAGAEVIGQNMKVGATAGVNAMVPGSKVEAIIGFCNIRNFMAATEVLKEKVMLFVNQVGEIVHGCVDDFHGAPNRNIGDAFLVMWRLTGNQPEKQTKLADMSLMSYVKIIAEINKSRVLAVYRQHPGLQFRIKDFRVELGFGLHCGWAIEGAIGSEYKIDASYLSPNVNVASKLEAATSQFKVWMLLSHSMVNMCSNEVALNCRLIDQVTVSGFGMPMRIYTMDLDVSRIHVVEQGPDRIIRNRFKIRQLREVRKSEKMAEEYHVWDAMSSNPDVRLMRQLFSEEFFQRFAMAYRNYEAGEWLAARDMLFTCHYQPQPDIGRRLVTSEADWPADGPTVTLLKFMQQWDFEAPSTWPGHRLLPE